MSEAPVTIVVARADNGVIGKDGGLPWHLPADLKHFKQVTMGTAMIMGRRTFDSLPGLLPGRRHIVLTRDPDWARDPGSRSGTGGVEVAHDAEAALALARGAPISIIGGAEIFALFEPRADAVELTEVHCDADGDTRMPPFDQARWRAVTRETHAAEGGRPAYSFVRLERRG